VEVEEEEGEEEEEGGEGEEEGGGGGSCCKGYREVEVKKYGDTREWTEKNGRLQLKRPRLSEGR
jgi:hypothetical protein